MQKAFTIFRYTHESGTTKIYAFIIFRCTHLLFSDIFIFEMEFPSRLKKLALLGGAACTAIGGMGTNSAEFYFVNA